MPPDVELVRLSFPARDPVEVEPFAVDGIRLHAFELEIGDASVTAMEWLDGAGTVMAATTDGANTLSRGFNLMEYVEAILPEYLILAAERSSVVVRSPTSDQEFTIRLPTDPIATSNPPGISHAPDGTHVLADDDGETVFALAISVYPDGCTGAPDCASSSDKEQMDAIFAALAGHSRPSRDPSRYLPFLRVARVSTFIGR